MAVAPSTDLLQPSLCIVIDITGPELRPPRCIIVPLYWTLDHGRLQVVGECARDNDLEVNPVREKKLTNIRTVNADEKVGPPWPACSIVGPHIPIALMHVAVVCLVVDR